MPRRVRYCDNHPDKRAHGHGLCVDCYNAKLRAENPAYLAAQQAGHRAWYHKSKAYSAQQSSTWYQKNAEEMRLRARARWRQKTAEERWAINLKGTYGLTAEEYYRLLERQDGRCAICRELPVGKKLVVDHCQKRGPDHVRGLLCTRCNTMLGYLERSDIDIIRKALDYAGQVGVAAKTVRSGRTRRQLPKSEATA